MNSTSASSLVDVQKLNLVLETEVYQMATIRDAFVKATSHPIEYFRRPKDRLHLLKDLTFTIQRGERVGLMGVNGAGKTSLCRCIAGIYKASSGQVQVTGEIRAIFNTSTAVQPELTGRENALLFVTLMYPEIEDPTSLIEDALKFSELGRFLDIPFRNYSNGMQARLCLSLISALPAELLILDEVFDGADSHFKEKISDRVQKMIEGSGAVIFVSHSPDQVHRVCSRLLILDQGHVAHDGGVEEGLEKYKNLQPAFFG